MDPTVEDSSRARAVIGIIATAALVMITALVFFREPPPSVEKYLLLLLGALIAFCADVKQFYFGSSSGSKTLTAAQSETVRTLSKAVATSTPVVVTPPAEVPAANVGEGEKKVPAPAPDEIAGVEAARGGALSEFLKKMKDQGSPLTEEHLARIWIIHNGS